MPEKIKLRMSKYMGLLSIKKKGSKNQTSPILSSKIIDSIENINANGSNQPEINLILREKIVTTTRGISVYFIATVFYAEE